MLTQIKFGTSQTCNQRSGRSVCRLADGQRRDFIVGRNQVGSFSPQCENFRLTPEVKTKFTKKLKSDPREVCGRAVRTALFG